MLLNDCEGVTERGWEGEGVNLIGGTMSVESSASVALVACSTNHHLW